MESYVEKILNGKDPAKKGKGFWNDLAVHWELSEDDMRKYAEFFNWRKLSDHQKNMSESFIRENADRVHWDRISQRIQMSEDFIDEFKDKVTWDYIWSYQRHLSCKFIENHLSCCKRVDWNRIVMYQRLTDDFMKKHIDDLSIGNVIEYQKLKLDMVEFIESYIKTLPEKDRANNEEKILCYKIEKFDVTEKEMLRYIKLRGNRGWGGKGWWIILQHQKLSEEFLEKNYDKIKNDYNSINDLWRHQPLSEEFLKKHKKDVKWDKVKDNRKIKKTEWIKERLK